MVLRIRTLLVAVAVALGVILPGSTALAAEPPEHAAGGYPPGGVVRGEWIEWHDGAVQLSIGPTATKEDCPLGWICLFEHDDFNAWQPWGRMLRFNDPDYFQHLADYGFNDKMSSWWNRTYYDASWWEHNPAANSHCMLAWSQASSVSPDNSATLLYIRDFGCR